MAAMMAQMMMGGGGGDMDMERMMSMMSGEGEMDDEALAAMMGLGGGPARPPSKSKKTRRGGKKKKRPVSRGNAPASAPAAAPEAPAEARPPKLGDRVECDWGEGVVKFLGDAQCEYQLRPQARQRADFASMALGGMTSLISAQARCTTPRATPGSAWRWTTRGARMTGLSRGHSISNASRSME